MAGFIGSNVAEYYAKNSENRIYGIDNLSRDKLLLTEMKNPNANIEYLNDNYSNIAFSEQDVRNYSFVLKLLKERNINVIVHCAAQTAVTTSITNPYSDYKNNLEASFNLLHSIRQSDIDPTIIYCSTNKVYGNNVNSNNKDTIIELEKRYMNEIIDEKCSIDLTEHTPYGCSKLCSDLYFQEFGRTYGFKTGVFRMSCIYGPRQFGIEDQGWVVHFILSVLKQKTINIYGDGKQVRDILYISDLVEAFDSYVKKANQLKHQVYNMGGGIDNTISLLELIEFLENELGYEIPLKYYDWRPSDQKVYISDISKAVQQLQWMPKVCSSEGIKLCLDYYKKHI